MSEKKDLSDEEVEEMLERDLKANQAKQDNCGTAIPPNRETGIQKTQQMKMKEKKE